jgi:oligopeptide transport system permease protein
VEATSQTFEQGRSGKPRSLWQDAVRRLLRNKASMTGGLLIVLMTLTCIAGPWFSAYAYDEQNLERQFESPSTEHWLGTDAKGRDLFVRCLHGGRVSLAVGVIATAVSLVVGVLYGAVSGYAGGKTDEFMMRVVDVLYALPYIVMVILLVLYLGRNIYNLFLALGLVQWLTLARITRGQVLHVKGQEFIDGARAMGASGRRIMFLHIIPNILGPVIVYATLTVPSVMLNEAFLSFLGLGVQAPMASWGSLAAEGAANINPLRVYWWLVVFPGGLLALTLFAMNFFGDGLRDALDPRSRERVF